jgi:hypothetical protein
MSTIANIRIETWGDKFVVTGEFERFSEIPIEKFDSYGEALKALAQVVKREEMRYESRVRRNFLG